MQHQKVFLNVTSSSRDGGGTSISCTAGRYAQAPRFAHSHRVHARDLRDGEELRRGGRDHRRALPVTATAVEETHLLAISKNDFRRVAQTFPQVGIASALIMARRTNRSWRRASATSRSRRSMWTRAARSPRTSPASTASCRSPSAARPSGGDGRSAQPRRLRRRSAPHATSTSSRSASPRLRQIPPAPSPRRTVTSERRA